MSKKEYGHVVLAAAVPSSDVDVVSVHTLLLLLMHCHKICQGRTLRVVTVALTTVRFNELNN